MNNVIKIENLTKMYGSARGVIDINLTVHEGEIHGFIGPNGAGKSTTIKTILGLISKTNGTIEVFGNDHELSREKMLADIGYLPSEVFYYDNMRAIDLLNYSASFYNKDCSEKIKYLAEVLQLDLNQKIDNMSLGNKKKVGIIQGLLHSPKLIILDEPTSGLDPLIQQKFFSLIKEENKRGATVLFSSHILSEVQKICDRVTIIKEGKIIETRLISELSHNTYRKVSFMLNEKFEDQNLEGITNYTENEAISFMYSGSIKRLLNVLGKYNITNLQIIEPSLEEIFLQHYQ